MVCLSLSPLRVLFPATPTQPATELQGHTATVHQETTWGPSLPPAVCKPPDRRAYLGSQHTPEREGMP